MTETTRQLPLELPHEAAMTRADFLVGRANEAAVGLIDRYPDWPTPVVLLVGPVGSGKTHLGRIWSRAAGAAERSASALAEAELEALVGQGAVLVEDIHAPGLSEPTLFHLLNLARERGARVVLTSRLFPQALGLKVRDLESRLRAAQPAELAEPDDDLLRRVMVKLFADRQLAVEPAVVDYVVRRMERSLGAANALVEELDRAALAAGRPITRQLAATVLEAGFADEPELPLDD